jgi:hypothetical protein
LWQPAARRTALRAASAGCELRGGCEAFVLGRKIRAELIKGTERGAECRRQHLRHKLTKGRNVVSA